MRWLVLVLVGTQCLQVVLAAKILALCTVASHSHSLWCYKYMAALAERGHQITVLGVDEPKIKIANMKTFIVEGVYDAILSKENIKEYITMARSQIETLNGIFTWLKGTSEIVLNSEALRDLIHEHSNTEKPFDLIIHDDASCAGAILGLVPLFGNPPLVLATPSKLAQWITFRAGNIFNPAYVPHMLMNFTTNMDFYERAFNTFYYMATEWFTHYKFERHQEHLKSLRFGDGFSHVRDLAKRANIIIFNYHPAFDSPRPFSPGVIGIAGLHIGEPKPLRLDIKNFMDGAEHGVILFSLGSNVDSSWFAEDFEDVVSDALGELPQRVVWKWDRTPVNVPPNVKMGKWLPQTDMLVHPNLRLFITHCGLLSTQEAIFHKVPLLALPVFIDQLDNADMLVQRNLTIKLDPHALTSAKLINGIREILNNPKYKTNIEKLGELVRDMPLTAKQEAVFWTEYAIRHDGAPHLRSPAADMPWYQLLLLDVFGFVVFAVFFILWLFSLIVSYSLSLLCVTKFKND